MLVTPIPSPQDNFTIHRELRGPCTVVISLKCLEQKFVVARLGRAERKPPSQKSTDEHGTP